MSVFKKEEPAAATNGLLKETSAYSVSKTGGEVDSQTNTETHRAIRHVFHTAAHCASFMP